MGDVGDAVEIIYSVTPNADVTVTWSNRDTGEVALSGVAVPERLDDQGGATGLFPVTLTGTSAGLWEAKFVSSGTSDTVESYYERFEVPSAEPPFAAMSEYTEIYGTLTTAQQATCRALLRRAARLVRDSYPGIDRRIAASTVSAGTVGLVTINMAAAVLRNPQGLRSSTTGPFSRSWDPDAASGRLRLTDDDREMLADAGADASSGKRKGKIGTARVKANLAPPVHRRHHFGGGW